MGLQDKIKVANNSTLEYKQALWKILIAHGGPVVLHETDNYGRPFSDVAEAIGAYHNWNFYSGRPQTMPVELAEQALVGIREHGIDWENSTIPETGEEHEFQGTFTSSVGDVPFLCGKLALKNGDEYIFWVHNKGVDFGTMVRLVTDENATLEDALEDFEDHITNPVIRKYGHWEYTLEVPAGWRREGSGYQEND